MNNSESKKKLAIASIPASLAFFSGVLANLGYRMLKELPLYSLCNEIAKNQNSLFTEQENSLILEAIEPKQKYLQLFGSVLCFVATLGLSYLWMNVFKEIKNSKIMMPLKIICPSMIAFFAGWEIAERNGQSTALTNPDALRIAGNLIERKTGTNIYQGI